MDGKSEILQLDEASSNSLDSEAGYHSDSSSDIAASDDDLDSLREFCFETPRLAYKANNDYKELLQAIVLWKAQLAQAKRDRQLLLKQKEKAAADPLQFVEDMKDKVVEFPKPQKIASVPNINLCKYNASELCIERSEGLATLSTDQGEEDEGSTNAPKFNQMPCGLKTMWSEAEQKRLESLLLIYPPEEVEARRWEKIACALGTRTPRQVASRVQKYFIKLAKAGGSVPGRTPNLAFMNKHKRRSRLKDHSSVLAKSKVIAKCEEMEVSDEDDVHPELRNTSEYQDLILIKKVLKMKKEQIRAHALGELNIPESSNNIAKSISR